jgi:hypothetical protein
MNKSIRASVLSRREVMIGAAGLTARAMAASPNRRIFFWTPARN